MRAKKLKPEPEKTGKELHISARNEYMKAKELENELKNHESQFQ